MAVRNCAMDWRQGTAQQSHLRNYAQYLFCEVRAVCMPNTLICYTGSHG